MARSILVLNGPNLNLLGTRQPEIYGHDTLADVEALCRTVAAELDLAIDFRQSNSEGELIGWIHEAQKTHDALLINAAGYTHTSVAIADALVAISLPAVEIHMSNIHAREPFRSHSTISPVAKGLICGFGSDSYRLGLIALAQLLSTEPEA
ncbi:MAG TPA: type II 3-dehydroquinate dehydratase [Alphaproteobacteria bacterium]|nr:type II 3-dehydroquinate dehydratase [Alphaproteobacteria bacterium]|tara:strand:+ start:619 stop:1071 length:453 start_codon:yes stop_codon:yes gene_type:complete